MMPAFNVLQLELRSDLRPRNMNRSRSPRRQPTLDVRNRTDRLLEREDNLVTAIAHLKMAMQATREVLVQEMDTTMSATAQRLTAHEDGTNRLTDAEWIEIGQTLRMIKFYCYMFESCGETCRLAHLVCDHRTTQENYIEFQEQLTDMKRETEEARREMDDEDASSVNEIMEHWIRPHVKTIQTSIQAL